jgi:hypothetical protein
MYKQAGNFKKIFKTEKKKKKKRKKVTKEKKKKQKLTENRPN